MKANVDLKTDHRNDSGRARRHRAAPVTAEISRQRRLPGFEREAEAS